MSNAEGVIAKFQAIKGETPKGVLDSPLRLPAVIGNITAEEESNHSEYETVADGQFSQAQQGGGNARMLRALDGLEAIALNYDAPFLVETGQDPADVKNRLTAILRSHKAVEMMLVPRFGDAPLLRMYVTFRSVREELRQQENDTLYFVVSIKEWRNPSVERKGSTHKAARKPGVQFPTTKKLDANDTLHSLSNDYYGSYEFWRDIRAANGITPKFGQSTPLVQLPRFKVGSVIKLPKIATGKAAA